MPNRNQQAEHTDHFTALSVADFYERLNRVRTGLGFDIAAYLPGAARYTRIKVENVHQVLSFFGLQDAADALRQSDGTSVPVEAYHALNKFLRNINYEQFQDLSDRWDRSWVIIGGAEPDEGEPHHDLQSFVEQAQEDPVVGRGLDANGLESLPADQIGSVLYVLLLWLTALPCQQTAKEEQARYRKRLRNKMGVLLSTGLENEFQNMVQKIMNDTMHQDLVKQRRPEYLQHGKNTGVSQENEHDLNHDVHLGK